jgi:hypothetical protein
LSINHPRFSSRPAASEVGGGGRPKREVTANRLRRLPIAPGTPWFGIEELEPRLCLSTIRWDGGGGDSSWHNPLNWAGDVLPGPNDDVIIDTPGTVTHTQNVTTTVRSIFSTDPIVLSGGTISVAVEWRQAAALTINGGAVAGAGNLILNAAGNWTSGTASGTGKIQILPGRSLTIGGDVTLSRAVVNNGVLIWQSGNIAGDGGAILNLSDHAMYLRSPGSFTQTGAASSLTNQGLLVRDGTSDTTTTIAVTFNNHPGAIVAGQIIVGTVDVASGTLAITGPFLQRVGDTLVGGRWIVGASGTLQIPGGDLTSAQGGLSEVVLSGAASSFPALENASSFRILTLAGGRAFTFQNATDAAILAIANPGTTAVRSMIVGELNVFGGTVVADGLIGHRIVISAGSVLTLTGSSWLSNAAVEGGGLLNVVGTLEWISGVMAGPGQMLVGPAGVLHLRADPSSPVNHSTKWLARRTVNYGTIEWDDTSGWGFQLGTELVNRGTFNMDTTGYLSTTAVGLASVPAYITNFGTINKNTAGDLTLRGAGGGVRLANLGTVNVGLGRLFVQGGTGASGSWQSAAGAELVFGGLAQALTGAILGGAGRIRLASDAVWNNVTLAQNGDLVITPAANVLVAGSDEWSRSTIYVQGTLYFAAAADIRLQGNVINTGRLAIDKAAVEFQITGNVILGTSSIVYAAIAGPGQFGRLVVNGDIALGGQMFGVFSSPADAGVRFSFIQAATYSGAFAGFGSSGLAAGRTIQWQWIHQGILQEIGQIVVA